MTVVGPAASPERTLLRARHAAEPRTLVDILRETAGDHPTASALDNGSNVLSYEELVEAAEAVAVALRQNGVEVGDRVGIRIPSGTTDLYVAILGTLVAGAAYVPVDYDDPDDRARLVLGEAGTSALITTDLVVHPRAPHPEPATDAKAPGSVPDDPGIQDDAWVIFTSGSTGTPKGVAVSHRSAAAFVDAEARLFLQGAPLGPGDRVMAGLSVAFDASCEEMWLAWRHGACLVPVPRSLVRSGIDLGPWLVANDITVVSTVPTLVALWPPEALAAVRLLILGGEACPPEIGERLASSTREVWNTYGPTEATVVACAARLTGEPPVRIGLPLDGWDLEVVDEGGEPVGPGGTGQLIIGGVGLARYLDPAKDQEKYAAMPTLGWDRAYRSGDLVRRDIEGLVFVGRADDQVKVGGRRIELGEIDSALLSLPGVNGAAAAVRRTPTGNSLLVGYVTTDAGFDQRAASEALRSSMPAALVPRLAVVDTLPTRTSGKIDRDALPWPVESAATGSRSVVDLQGTAGWLQALWLEILGAEVTGRNDNFFDLGGGSLTAAQLVSRLRARFPETTMTDVYDHPAIADLAQVLDSMGTSTRRSNAPVLPVRRKTQVVQLLAAVPLRSLSALRWLTWLGAANALGARSLGLGWLPTVSWWWVAAGWLLLLTPPGRIVLCAVGARLVLRGVRPGRHPRGGRVHLRIWLAERLVDEVGATGSAGAPFTRALARALGAKVGRHVDLHSIPPVTGFLDLGDGCSVEPEVDLRGHWIDGDVLHVGSVRVGAGARIGTRSTLLPGADIGDRAEIAPGSAVFGVVPADVSWSGAPAAPSGTARGPWSLERPRNRPIWWLAYAACGVLIALLPLVAIACGALVVVPAVKDAASLGDSARTALLWLPVATVVTLAVLALLVWSLVRLMSVGLKTGHHPVHGRQAWQAWTIVRVLDEARTWLFPLYSSSLTPAWLRSMGATVGEGVEASTVLMIPTLTSVGAGAFLADDTLIGSYELGGGWLRVERVKIGKGAFIGNSGMAAPGRKVPKQGLVAVLSAAPRRAKAKRGTSWLGSPPQRLRRDTTAQDRARTVEPPRRLRIARASVEACRLVAVMAHVALVLAVVVVLDRLAMVAPWLAALTGGLVLVLAGAVAAALTTAAKLALVGRVDRTDHPLWSSFVWRNELADTFVEVLAAPWFARAATGTPALNVWLRSLGARIGRGVWCETYWLPEADLVELRAGATVNQGCVVQTHLFHDRVLSMDTVTLREGATLGPNSVILPAAVLGRHSTVGPVSLVMRGESVPDGTRWIGNPIGPWLDDDEVPA